MAAVVAREFSARKRLVASMEVVKSVPGVAARR
jgi:hypothetical protein